MRIIHAAVAGALVSATLVAAPGYAQKKNSGPGASDKEIKLGQTVSYSGPLSVFGTIGGISLG